LSLIRALVVEDFAPFRRFIGSMLSKKPELLILEEVADGLEAVQKAQALNPDLIFLDLGLPTLNGIEAARRIRKVSPESKIIFVTQESSSDVIQEAFRVGGRAYVLKTRATTDLLPAVEAVLAGRKFVTCGLQITLDLV
jgi:DNA-binding NarL/FixJ family response regulator